MAGRQQRRRRPCGPPRGVTLDKTREQAAVDARARGLMDVRDVRARESLVQDLLQMRNAADHSAVDLLSPDGLRASRELTEAEGAPVLMGGAH